jgi:hypothetical protein
MLEGCNCPRSSSDHAYFPQCISVLRPLTVTIYPKEKEMRVLTMLNSLTLSNKMLILERAKQITPQHGPWHEALQASGIAEL